VDSDVLVVGAGIAGAAAGFFLAATGGVGVSCGTTGGAGAPA